MNKRLKALIVVKQKPLFTALTHILSGFAEIGDIDHVRDWHCLKHRFKSKGFQQSYDLVLLEVTEAEQLEVVNLLRAHWPQARLVLLPFDREMISKRASAFDVVLAKNIALHHLKSGLRRVIDKSDYHQSRACFRTKSA